MSQDHLQLEIDNVTTRASMSSMAERQERRASCNEADIWGFRRVEIVVLIVLTSIGEAKRIEFQGVIEGSGVGVQCEPRSEIRRYLLGG